VDASRHPYDLWVHSECRTSIAFIAAANPEGV
jgi:hypothetical protein